MRQSAQMFQLNQILPSAAFYPPTLSVFRWLATVERKQWTDRVLGGETTVRLTASWADSRSNQAADKDP